MATVDRRYGYESAQAIKSPVRTASTGTITLSGSTQVIDGVTPSTGDRVLYWHSTGTDNGIYIVQSSSWIRAADFDGSRDVVTGTLVWVTSEATNYGGRFFKVTSTGANIPGTNNITFSSVDYPQGISAFGSTFITAANASSARSILGVGIVINGTEGIQTSTGAAISATSTGLFQLDFNGLTSLASFGSTIYFGIYASSTAAHRKLGSSAVAFMESTDQQFSGGANITSRSLSTGGFTVNYGAGPLQFITASSSAWTITASTKDGSCIVLVTNPLAPTSPTFSGFSTDTNTGNSVSTSSGGKYKVYFDTINNVSSYSIRTLST